MIATPQSPTISPVSVSDMADYVGADVTDPILQGLLIAATDAVIAHIRQDLLPRTWVATQYLESRAALQVSVYPLADGVVELPYSDASATVSSVTIDGTNIGYTPRIGRPSAVAISNPYITGQLRIEYTAGMSPIPVAITEGIKSVAAYLYEHRGRCDMSAAVQASGASYVLRPWRVEYCI